MALMATKKSVMTLYTSQDSPYCHRVRIVMAEKNVAYEMVDVDPANPPEDLLDLNPYQTVPTLVDRELVLYESRIIMEYLDERFPHPPLMPVDPVSRARSRLMMYRIDRDWYGLLPKMKGKSKSKEAETARRELLDSLLSIIPVFEAKPYFMSDEFSLVDCCIAPLLWRLPAYGVKLPKQARPIEDYAERLFQRESFQESLLDAEKALREA